jgi:hypothetical protein
MKKRTITIVFETDADDDVVNEIAEQMRWQLDSLCDGTLLMDDDGQPVDEDYIVKDIIVK